MEPRVYACSVTVSAERSVLQEFEWLWDFDRLEEYLHSECFQGTVEDLLLVGDDDTLTFCWLGDPLWEWVDGMADTYPEVAWKLWQFPDGIYEWIAGKHTRKEFEEIWGECKVVDIEQSDLDELCDW